MVLRAGDIPILSLCSGAGGLDIGVHGAMGGGARTVCYVEHEVTAAEVLVARIADGAVDDAPVWTDLHTFDACPLRGRLAGLIGGYPCQPFSNAGRRLGTADPRHLWPSISRIIAECEPDWCFFENVASHLRLGYWDVVRPDLERLGYRVAEGIFTAAEVGAPHRRERLFIMAHRNGDASPLPVKPGKGRARQSGGGGAGSDVAHAASIRLGGRGAERGAAEERSAREVQEPTRGRSALVSTFPPGTGDSAGGREVAAAEILNGARCQRCGAIERGSESAHRNGCGDMVATERLSTGARFPPGPSDYAAWQRILASRPDLAPARSRWDDYADALRASGFGEARYTGTRRARLMAQSKETGAAVDLPARAYDPARLPAEAQSVVRLLASRLASAPHISRSAQLRIIGNGVVPAQAALAFEYLWTSLHQ